jgi:hypothetical protein
MVSQVALGAGTREDMIVDTQDRVIDTLGKSSVFANYYVLASFSGRCLVSLGWGNLNCTE